MSQYLQIIHRQCYIVDLSSYDQDYKNMDYWDHLTIAAAALEHVLCLFKTTEKKNWSMNNCGAFFFFEGYPLLDSFDFRSRMLSIPPYLRPVKYPWGFNIVTCEPRQTLVLYDLHQIKHQHVVWKRGRGES